MRQVLFWNAVDEFCCGFIYNVDRFGATHILYVLYVCMLCVVPRKNMYTVTVERILIRTCILTRIDFDIGQAEIVSN